MTFTVVGRCKRTGHLGIGIATSSPAVMSRCVNVSRDGAVAFQSVPDPRLGAMGLRLIESGWWPQKVVDELVATDKWPGKRQIGIVNGDGHAAAYTGKDNAVWAGHIIGDNHVAMGNVLAGPEVAQAISEEFLATADLDLKNVCCEPSRPVATQAGRRKARPPQACWCTAGTLTRDSICASTSPKSLSPNCVASSTGTSP